MLSGVRIDDSHTLVDVSNQNDGALHTGQSFSNALNMLGAGNLRRDFPFDLVGQTLTRSDEDGCGDHIVLGLTDEVCGHVPSVR